VKISNNISQKTQRAVQEAWKQAWPLIGGFAACPKFLRRLRLSDGVNPVYYKAVYRTLWEEYGAKDANACRITPKLVTAALARIHEEILEKSENLEEELTVSQTHSWEELKVCQTHSEGLADPQSRSPRPDISIKKDLKNYDDDSKSTRGDPKKKSRTKHPRLTAEQVPEWARDIVRVWNETMADGYGPEFKINGYTALVPAVQAVINRWDIGPGVVLVLMEQAVESGRYEDGYEQPERYNRWTPGVKRPIGVLFTAMEDGTFPTETEVRAALEEYERRLHPAPPKPQPPAGEEEQNGPDRGSTSLTGANDCPCSYLAISDRASH